MNHSLVFQKFRVAGIVIALIVTSLLGWEFLRNPDHAAEETPDDFQTTESPAARDWQLFLSDNFAGDEACQECHAEQFAAQQRSGHSRTITPMSLSSLAEQLEGDEYQDPRRSQQLQFVKQNEQFFVSTEDDGREVNFPVSWLLGSGTHAQTPVSIDPGSGMGVEFRWTWFAGRKEIGVTPDHERFDDYQPGSLECFGRPLGKTQARACMNCHATAVPPENVPASLDHFMANVGCERCHGPRKNHVKLAHLGRADEAPPAFTYDDPAEYMDRCAQCHRDETNTPSESTPGELARFQPLRMKQSRCYLESQKTMTCSTCHDPHDRVTNDRSHYQKSCLSCHSAPEQSHCKVEPSGDCVKCHMPAVEWYSGIKFHDHRIQIPPGDN
jgi:hypothetical protein